MEIILFILIGISWFILLSINTKEPKENPLIQLKNELLLQKKSLEEINFILNEYKKSYDYSIYEFKKAYYELGKSIKDIFKNKGEE